MLEPDGMNHAGFSAGDVHPVQFGGRLSQLFIELEGREDGRDDR